MQLKAISHVSPQLCTKDVKMNLGSVIIKAYHDMLVWTQRYLTVCEFFQIS